MNNPDRVWIEDDGECPYFYHESELADAAGPLTEYVKVQKSSDADLVERAVRNAKNHHPCPTMPRWHAVKRVFGCGKTKAWELCERFNLDPADELHNTADSA